MSRGEPGADDGKAVGWAIAGIFAVACLATWLLVVWVNDRGEHEVVLADAEPFPGAETAFGTLTWRGCVTTTGDDPALLVPRGYQPVGGWTEASGMPAEIDTSTLEGGCGVLAVTAEPSGILSSGQVEGRPLVSVCTSTTLLVPTCGEAVRIAGSGLARTRLYVMPGVDDGAEDRIGLPLDAILAHAEAEHLLALSSFVPEGQLIQASALVGGTDLAEPAPEPPSGCVPYVAVGLDLSHAHTEWQGRSIAWGPAPSRLLTGVVSCAGARTTDLHVTASGGPLELTYRPYRRTPQPTFVSGVTATIGSATVVARDDLVVPPSEIDLGAE